MHDEQAAAEELAAQVLDRWEDEGPDALERVCAAHPPLAERIRTIIRRLQRTGLMQESGQDAAAPVVHGPGSVMGHYQLEEIVATGGMGVVYRARDTRLGREVALKLMRPECFYHPRSRARFAREAALAARLEHPNLCAVYEGAELDGVPYLAMRLIEGRSLGEIFREGVPEGSGSGDDALAERVRWIRDVTKAVEALHEGGLVHRDIKPDNVLLAAEGCPVLVDFGLAAERDVAGQLTVSGDRLGTPRYMAPEQLAQGLAEAPADIYALGVSLFEACTGGHPYGDFATMAELLDRMRRRPPTPPTQLNRRLSRDLETVILQALSFEPQNRYQSAALLAEDLSRCLALQVPRARRPGVPLRLSRWVRRNKPASGLVLMASLTALVTGVLLRQVASTKDDAVATAMFVEAQRIMDGDPSTAEALSYDAAVRMRDPAARGRALDALAGVLLRDHELASFKAHTGLCYQLEPTGSGRHLVTRGKDGRVCYWNVAARTAAAQIKLGAAAIEGLAADPASERMVAVGKDSRLHLCDVSGQSQAFVHPAHRFSAIAVSPDGRRIAFGTYDGQVGSLAMPAPGRLDLDGETLQLLPRPEGMPGVRGLAFNAQGVLGVATHGNKSYLWSFDEPSAPPVVLDRDEAKTPGSDAGFRPSVLGIQPFAIQGTEVAWLTRHQWTTAILWSADGRLIRLADWHRSTVWTASLSVSGLYGLSGSADGNGALIYYPDQENRIGGIPLQGHNRPVFATAICPDEIMSATGCEAGRINLWNWSGERVAQLLGHTDAVLGLRFVGAELWSCGRDGTVRVWRVGSELGPQAQVGGSSISFLLRDRAGVLVATRGGRIWQLDQGAAITWRSPDVHRKGRMQFEIRGLQRLSPERLVSVDELRNIRIWRPAETGYEVLEPSPTCPEAAGTITGLAVLGPDRFLTAHRDAGAERVQVLRWESAPDGSWSATPVVRNSGHGELYLMAADARAGRLVLSFETGRTALYDLQGRPLQDWSGPPGRSCVDLSAAALWISDGSGGLGRRDLDGRELIQFKAHGSRIQCLLALADGSVVTGAGPTLRRWSRDGEQLFDLSLPFAAVVLDADPAGSLWVGGIGGEVLRIPLDKEQWLAAGQRARADMDPATEARLMERMRALGIDK